MLAAYNVPRDSNLALGPSLEMQYLGCFLLILHPHIPNYG